MTKYYFTTDPEIFSESLIICTNGKQYRIVTILSNGHDCVSDADLDAARNYVIARSEGWDDEDISPTDEAEYKKLIDAYANRDDLYDWEDVITDIACDHPEEIRDLDFDPDELENAIVLRIMD